MDLLHWTKRAAMVAAVGALASSVWAAEPTTENGNVQDELQALKSRIAELEAKQNENWLNTERTNQIKEIVNEAIADAKTRGQFLDSNMNAGYKNGFYIQDGDNFKLVVGGFMQFRYAFAQQNKKNVSTPSGASDPGDANGFYIRRARISFSGYAYSPNIIYKFEGDFGGPASNSGNFQVTDAFIGYSFNDMFKIKAGSFKVPFAKEELESDTVLGLQERAEVLFPFDPVRALGVSLYGDIQKDKLTYEINANDGGKSNTAGRIDDTSGALDNRMAFYGRAQWAGGGKISEFADEPDLRDKNSDFIWMLGAAAGYESQNSTNNGYPARQTSTALTGLSSAPSPGFLGSQNFNGDLFRGTVDWSAKWTGWSFNTAAYFQQVNANGGTFPTTGSQAGTTAGTTVATAGSSSAVPPYGATDASFFQTGFYGQVGYMIIPKKFEVVARAGELLTEGYPNQSQYYSVGANYYLFGHGAKIQSDITYIPNEAAVTDSGSEQVANTQDIIYRIQLQVKF